MYYVYILQSIINKSYYTGSCKNINKRIFQHNTGKVKSTKKGIPWKLVYQESFASLSAARKREKQIKSWKKRKIIERLIISRK